MSQEHVPHVRDAEPEDRPSVQPLAVEFTGNADVDDVLTSLEALEHTPTPAQVPLFESAHETLRSALADAGNEQPTT